MSETRSVPISIEEMEAVLSMWGIEKTVFDERQKMNYPEVYRLTLQNVLNIIIEAANGDHSET